MAGMSEWSSTWLRSRNAKVKEDSKIDSKRSEGVEGGRSRRVIRNVLSGLLARGFAFALSLYSTWLMLRLMGAEDMGVWLVVLGILQWVSFFDLGIGYGARNAIARHMALGDRAAAARTISTAYFYNILVCGGIGLLLVIGFQLRLDALLDRFVFLGRDLRWLLLLCFLVFLVNLVLGFVQQVYAALEMAAASALYGLLVSVLYVAGLLLVPPLMGASIPVVAGCYCVAMLLPNLLMTIWLFMRYPELRPSAALVSHAERSPILSTGLSLFVVQLAALVIFSTDRLLVGALVGPAAVVRYDAGFKIFSAISMAHGMLMGILWSSFTHAHSLGDWRWIRGVLGKLNWLMLPLACGSALLGLLSPWIVQHWLGQDVVASLPLYWGFFAFTLLSCWSAIYANFLNGVGRVKWQMYSAIIAAVVNIPVSLIFVRHFGMGEAGVIWGTVVSLCFFSVIGPLQAAWLIREESGRT